METLWFDQIMKKIPSKQNIHRQEFHLGGKSVRAIAHGG